jgi:hypothetical protein
MEVVKLTREDLYERVWAEPMSRLAQHYGLSDVGLAKTCKRLRVPVPGRGYWAKKAAGHKVKQIPLPDLPPNVRQSEREVTLADRPVPQEPGTLPSSIRIQSEFEDAPENRIVVADSLRGAHPLVRKTSQALRGTAKSPTAFVGNWQEPHIDVQVSRDLLTYLSAMRAAAQDQLWASEPSKAVDDWLLWAEAHAASLNPLPAQLEQLAASIRPQRDD